MTPNQQQNSHLGDLVIDLSQPSEVAYWTKFFQCTEIQLRSAIALTGPLAGPVRRYLAIKTPIPTLTDLLRRHLALIQAPIPAQLAGSLASLHILNRCGNLQVDLLPWRRFPTYPQELANQLFELSHQDGLPAQTLQAQLALLVQEAIEK